MTTFPTRMAAALAFASLAWSAAAGQLNWAGPAPGTTDSPIGGLWDTNSPHWNAGSGSGAVTFTHGVDGAVFGGADGEYLVSVTNLSATNITFIASGYVLSNEAPATVSVTGNNRGLAVAAGKTATIGTNVTVSGTGNPFHFNTGVASAGTLIIEQGGIFQQQNNQPFNFDGGVGSTIRVKSGGLLRHTGNGSNIRFGLTANSAPELHLEGGSFLCTGGSSFGSVILSAANSSTTTVTIVEGTFSNPYTANSANGSLNLGNGAPSLTTVNLDGGVLAVGNLRKTSANSQALSFLNLNGGTLRALSASAAANFVPANLNNVTMNVRNGGAVIDANSFNVQIGHPLIHSTVPGDNAIDGGIAIAGFGTVTLAATNTYTGPTVITNGVLSLGSSGRIDTSSLIHVASLGTLNLSNQMVLNSAGTFKMSDGTVRLNINNFPTNIVTGTLATEGSFNVIDIPIIVGSGSIPQATPLIKYTTLAQGVVDENNNLLNLYLTLPPTFSGVLSNNTAKKTIDLVLTSGSLKPEIVKDPVSLTRFPGGTAQFSVISRGADGHFWRQNGSFLDDGGDISGSKTDVLTLANVAASGNYDVVLTNASGAVTSMVATLTVLTPTWYQGTNALFSPVAYYGLNEGDTTQPANDYVGGKDGIYLANTVPVPGPTPADGYANFPGDNVAFQAQAGFGNAHVVVSNSWNINTNTVTLVGWIYPAGFQSSFAGLIFQRGGGVVSGLNFSDGVNANGERTLGYTWNNDSGTYGWNSGLAVPSGQWSMVALVVTPTNATVYVGNTTGLASASQTRTHAVQSFVGPIAIGADPFDPMTRSFTGYIDEVAAFDRALTRDQLQAMLTAASGISEFPPMIPVQPPANTSVYEHQTVTFSAQAFGSGTLHYQWKRGVFGSYNDVPNGLTVDGSVFSGGNSPTLTISNVALGDTMEYIMVVTNLLGETTSTVANLVVNPVQPAENITMSVVQSGGQDWNTGASWSDGLPASESAVQKWGSTYAILAGAAMRTPELGNPATPTSATFPGDQLTIQGNGVFTTSISGSGIGALLIKGGNPASVHFKKLIMNGGQILSFVNSGRPAALSGELNILANTPIYAADDTSPRTITIASVLTGNGNVEYRGYSGSAFRTDTSAALNVANANNPYTGTWDVVIGTLVGSAQNALGTNNITVRSAGALQANYNLSNPAATLTLDGRLNLTGDHTFKHVIVSGNQLSPGTYSFATLNAAYPTQFPSNWTAVSGALETTNASGSLIVLDGPAGPTDPGTVVVTQSGGNIQITWTNASTLLLSSTNLLGPWVTNSGATSPYTVTNDTPQKFFRLQAQ